MNNLNQAGGQIGALAGQHSLSRIESDVENLKQMTRSVEMTTERIIRHARSLGYFEPPSDAKAQGQAPTPVVTTLADALQSLSRAIDHCSGSLNVFD